ncbi:MAG: transcription antitermination factor NusB [Ilumatobacteraceae bacterium]
MTAQTSPRRLALDLLRRIEDDGAYANLVVPSALDRSGLGTSERAMVTDLVYGTTRMRRACDGLFSRHVVSEPDPATRRLLRLGTYQWAWGRVPAHAAVSETVSLAPRRVRGFVNAVLRRTVAGPMPSEARWASSAAALSYPDWIHDRLTVELGEPDGIAAMDRMNRPPSVTVRSDGYVQDRASTWVAESVEAISGETVVDLCAAPGGKATAVAASGATVLAADVRESRVGLVASNAARFASEGLVLPIVADGQRPPVAPRCVDAVLIDAPCSGLGALRRRPDARWRIDERALSELTRVQQRLLDSGADLVRPGGRLVYSVCTLTAAESIDLTTPAGFEVDTRPPPGEWRPFGHGWRILPQDHDTDGMVLIRYRRSS